MKTTRMWQRFKNDVLYTIRLEGEFSANDVNIHWGSNEYPSSKLTNYFKYLDCSLSEVNRRREEPWK